ncbi:MAG: cytochrome c oxidase subunit II [Vicinamibacterales bacterium]
MNQSVLAPLGVQAAHIASLWWALLIVSTVVFVLVMCGLITAVVRSRRTAGADGAPPSDSVLSRIVATAVGLTVVTLFGWLIASLVTGRAVGALHAEHALTVEVVGHQWWWEVHYDADEPSARVTTANEMHLPVHRPVAIRVTSRDVIHSLWIPTLQGKRDLIPGRETVVWMQADAPGMVRGQCAEFCGMQHAHMALNVIAESDADFERWRTNLRRSAPQPTDVDAHRGQAIFLTARCAGCHTVRGIDAAGLVGPDLTHLAARSSIGAGTLANTPADLEHWIRNPQAFKPGTQMPPSPLPSDDLRALVSYLETLQ